VATRSYELSQTPLKGRFDLAHLQAIHRYLFGDVYGWAVQLRTIDIRKASNRFAYYAHIESAAASIFQQLAKENQLTGLDEAAFSARAAYYLGELNALHAFREGNGRAQREFISHLAHANGYYFREGDKVNEKALKTLIRAALALNTSLDSDGYGGGGRRAGGISGHCRSDEADGGCIRNNSAYTHIVGPNEDDWESIGGLRYS
jgi:fido (protein-threonine AMPylation protein)